MTNRGTTAPGNTYHSPWVRRTASATALLATLSLGGCQPLNGEQPRALPGERLGQVRITTLPPGLRVRILSQVVAGPPAIVQNVQPPEKSGPSPQEVSVSYQPGHGTRMVVRAFLSDAPPQGKTAKLECDVYADGRLIEGASDSDYVDESNMQTAYVLCTFDENLAPPLPAGGN